MVYGKVVCKMAMMKQRDDKKTLGRAGARPGDSCGGGASQPDFRGAGPQSRRGSVKGRGAQSCTVATAGSRPQTGSAPSVRRAAAQNARTRGVHHAVSGANTRRFSLQRLCAPGTRRLFRSRAAKVVAVVVSVALAAGILPAALAAVEWPTTIQRFENLDPVYSVSVEAGSAVDDLALPASLRALVPLTDSQKSSEFKQAQPVADTSDGYESYDYYWYGYVAPPKADELYEQEKRVVYYITYAARDDSGEETSTVGDIAYRVYGTMGGSTAAWFACDKDGNPTEQVVDVLVSWDTSTLDLSATGTSYALGSLSGYSYFGAAPRAEVIVQEKRNCTCGAGDDAAEHAEDCPLHDEDSCTEHVDGVEELGADADVDAAIANIEADTIDETSAGESATLSDEVESSVEEEEALADSTALASVATSESAKTDGAGIESTDVDTDATTLETDDDDADADAQSTTNAVDASECTCGMDDAPAREYALDCPVYVEPAGEDCHCAEDGGPIDASNFPWAHHMDCPYYSPVECMCREQVEISVVQTNESGEDQGEAMESVPGDYSHVHDPDNIDCPLHGKEVVKVAKERDVFDATSSGSVALASEELVADDDLAASGITSYMAKDEAERIVNAQQGGETLYATLGKIAVVEEETNVFEVAAGALQDAANAVVSLFTAKKAQAASGAQDTVFENFVTENIPAKVTSPMTFVHYGITKPWEVSTSAAWVTYINTVYLNKVGKSMDWETSTGALAAWTGKSSNQSGTPSTNPLAYPVTSSGVWNVYSGEQLRYALENYTSSSNIKLQRDIDLNGSNYNWEAVVLQRTGLTLYGNGKTIYNGSTYVASMDTAGTRSCFARIIPGQEGYDGEPEVYSVTVKDLSFSNYRIGCKYNPSSVPENGLEYVCAAIFSCGKKTGSWAAGGSFSNVHVKKSRVVAIDEGNKDKTLSGEVNVRTRLVPSFFLDAQGLTGWTGSSVTNCSVQDSGMYAMSHVNPFAMNCASTMTIDKCFTANNVICSVGVHSASFMSCFNTDGTAVKNSFAANEMYGSYIVSGFNGFAGSTLTDCFSTGKVEGYQYLGGFVWSGNNRTRNINRCYSTCLVGMRSMKEAKDGIGIQGGFATWEDVGETSVLKLVDCYAAGEVGNFDVDMDKNTQLVGGFLSQDKSDGSTFSNCYYDKQTTAMREWVTGESNTGSLDGVTGVFTGGTESDAYHKGGTGLASGKAGTAGFTGFGTSGWQLESGRYPQLTAFSAATSSTWGSDELANTAKAWSRASTATVILDRWETGYTWGSADGIRSADKTAYEDTTKAQYTGNLYTYDTVRDIVSDATATSPYNKSATDSTGVVLSTQVEGGMYTNVTDTTGESSGKETGIICVSVNDDGQYVGTVGVPGVEWGNLTCYSGGKSATRPIRLAGMEEVEAGEDATINEGDLYDHRGQNSDTQKPKFTMLNTNVDNLVLGVDNTQAWAEAVRTDYPDSYAFYDVVSPAFSDNSLTTTKNPKLYTDIRRVKQNADGSYVKTTDGAYVEDLVIEDVSAAGTNTVADMQWTGQTDFRVDVSFGRTYQVSYYLMTNDGRYRSDSKYVTVQPGSFTSTVNAYYSTAQTTKNTTAMHLGTAADTLTTTASTPDYSVSSGTVGTAAEANIGYGRNATIAWKKDNDGVRITGGKLTFKTRGTTNKSVAFSGDPAGKSITLTSLPYYKSAYSTLSGRTDGLKKETINSALASLTYTVAQDSTTGNYYLRFNKLRNAPADEATSATLGGTSTGVSITSGNTGAYVNDMQFDVTLDLYVTEDLPFKFTKTDAGTGATLSGATFQLKQGSTSKGTVTADDDGIVDFGYLAAGTYTLTETAAPSGYDAAGGSWTVVVTSDETTKNITVTANSGATAFTGSYADGDFAVANEPTLVPFSFTKTNAADGAALAGATFNLKGVSGTSAAQAVDKNATSAASTGKVDFGDLPGGVYTLTETAAPSGYTVPSGTWTVVVDATKSTVTMSATGDAPTPTGSSSAGWKVSNSEGSVPFSFTKTDADGAALADVTFNLKGVSGSETAKAVNKSVTSETGTGLVSFGSLPSGTYQLTEAAWPTRYEQIFGSWTVVVDADAGTVTVTAVGAAPAFTGTQATGYKLANTLKKLPFSFEKTDADGAALAGATFGLYSSTTMSADTLVKSVVSASGTGLVDFGELDAGTYYLAETAAPATYDAPSGYWKIDVNTTDACTVSITSVGGAPAFTGTYADGDLALANGLSTTPFSFTKTDADGAALAGATFQLKGVSGTSAATEVDMTVTSASSTGLVDFGSLASGTYQLKETSAPARYDQISGTWTVVVDTDAGTVTVTAADGATAFTGSQAAGYKLANTLKKLPFSFTKTDEEAAALAGATFGLYSSTTMSADTLVKSVVSASGTGLVDFGELDAGTYYLAETAAPDGYDKISGYWRVAVNTTDTCTVTVAAVGEATSFTGSYATGWKLANTKSSVPFSFTKTNAAGNPLARAHFKLVSNPSGTFEKTAKSGEDGVVDFGDLVEGSYVLSETAAPDGYNLPYLRTWDVVVSSDGTVSVKAQSTTTQLEPVEFDGDYESGYTLANYTSLSLSIVKTDEEGSPLAGAKFTLEDAGGSGAYTSTATSNASGTVAFADLNDSGVYKLYEVTAPEDYEKIEGTWKVTVDVAARTVVIATDTATKAFTGDYANGYKLANSKTPAETVSFSFTKVDESGAALAGATFALYACGDATHTKAADHSATATNDAGCCWKVDDPVSTVTTPADGKADFGGLASGQYMLVETAAPSGYRLPHGQWMVDADASAQTVTITARGDDLPPAFKKDATTGAYSLPNYKEWNMPLTGGTGTIALTATGAALVAAAGAWWLFLRRKKAGDA